MAFCIQCGHLVADAARFCPGCGRAVATPAARAGPVPPPASPAPSVLATALRPAPPAVAAMPPTERGRPHSPLLALLAAFVIPGAGQAYNGQPIKALFLFFLAPLVLPQLYAVYDAYSTGVYIRNSGGRYGSGGVLWIGIQAWLYANVLLFVVIVLSVAGVVP